MLENNKIELRQTKRKRDNNVTSSARSNNNNNKLSTLIVYNYTTYNNGNFRMTYILLL